MSIRSSFQRVRENTNSFDKKSYKDLDIDFDIISAKDFLKQPDASDLHERIYKIEYSVDKVQKIFRLYNKQKSKFINVFELRDFFFDVGFNVDVLMSEIFRSDITMVYNLGGYIVPCWKRLISFIFKKRPRYKRMFLTALSPGKKRLHCRIYHGSDGTWYITSHLDNVNWLNILNLSGIFKSHFVRGTGNYDLGSEIIERVLDKAIKLHRNKRNPLVDVNNIYEEFAQSVVEENPTQ